MIYDVIIIGGGPAGISASSYCHRLGLNELLIYEEFGGQVNYCDKIFSIPSSPAISKSRLLSNYKTTVKDVNKVNEKVIRLIKQGQKFQVFTNIHIFLSKTVIVCTGAAPRRIEELIDLSKSTIPVLSYLDYPYNNCFMCDSVVIIGGGYVGLEIAYHLSKKAKKISIIEKSNHLGGNKYRQKSLEPLNNIQFYMSSNLYKIEYNEVTIEQNSEKINLNADFVFSAFGIKPNTEILPFLNSKSQGVNIIRNGNKSFINMNSDMKGLFAAGDVVNLAINGFVSFAEGMGIETAKSVFYYLNNYLNNSAND